MFIATWNGVEIARSSNTIEIERNQYFPPEDVKMEYFTKTDYTTTCPWKGLASYYTITVNDKTNENGAWYYPAPKEKATQIKDYVAFWNGVIIEKV